MNVRLENWPVNGMALDNNHDLRPIPEGPLVVTSRNLTGNERFGFGQYAVQLNGVVWVNEIYVLEVK